MSKDDLCETFRPARRQVFRFIAAFDQNCPVCFPELVIKQHDKIIWTVIHWVAIVRLYRPQYQRELCPSPRVHCWREPAAVML